MSKLFRDEVIQRRLSEIGVPSGITHGWMKLFALTLAAMIAAASTGVAFGSYARKARVGGFLVPDKGLIKVVATRGGRIAERRVDEGQHVAKDDVVARCGRHMRICGSTWPRCLPPHTTVASSGDAWRTVCHVPHRCGY